MHTARELLRAKLLPWAVLQDVRLMPYPVQLGELEGPVLMLRLDEVTLSNMPQAWRRYRFTLVLAVDTAEPGRADDKLDALLDGLLDALDASDLPAWSSATRAVLTDGQDRPTWPAYEVGLTLDTTHAP